MTENRILDITETSFYLRAENNLLIMEEKNNENAPPITIPFSDIAVVILSNKQNILTQSVLSSLAANKAFLIVCDHKNMPIATMLPLYGHTLQAARFRKQALASKPKQKQLWKQIVSAKIKAQANLLKQLHNKDFGLYALATQVKSGDKTNLEARAAQIYWRNFFQNTVNFYRQPQTGEPPNHLFDYGYAILRAIVARAIVSSGLNVTFGIHHHHRENSFCLADDLMEPLRPIVDKAVFKIVCNYGENAPLNKEIKQKLISPLLQKFKINEEYRTLFDIASKMASSLVAVYEDESNSLLLPDNINEYQQL